jgi:hypothetical protein
MCEWVPVADRWDRAENIVAQVVSAADEGDLVGVRLFADRLAGLSRCHDGDLDSGVEILARARDGFLEHGATWEAARTDVAIVEALSDTGLDDGQRDRLANASDLFERLGSVAELRRARAASSS